MKSWRAAALMAVAALALPARAQVRPKSGPVEIMPSSELRPGMKGYAWTVFAGTEPEAIPVEIIGLLKNAWGPQQDVILAKMGGKALRTNVAGGMSGSPVYVNGKLIGAVALRLSVFSPDAICGITPIELMLEIKDFDTSTPAGARTPDKAAAQNALPLSGEMAAQMVAAGAPGNLPRQNPILVPIETPLAFSGFAPEVLREYGPLFEQLGLAAVEGGASGRLDSPKPAPGWQNALQPGDVVTGVLVSGDMSVSGLGTVTYNDGRRVLAFGHPFFNLGPVDMPMSKGEILLTNASAFQPNKFGNSTEIVGALQQDRHSGILGLLGATAEMAPVTVRLRSFNEDNSIRTEKELHFNVFVQQKWTPFLMMATLANSIADFNEYREECTYRVNGRVELDGQQKMLVSTMQAPSELAIPAPVALAGWWGDKFSRLFMNTVTAPRLKRVEATVDLLPDRRVATIESAFIPENEVTPGEEVPVRVFLRPYRGPRLERTVNLRIPADLARGEYRILLSDADTLNRIASQAGFMNRSIDLPQIVSLLNQERANDKLYVSLAEARPTIYYDDKTLPSLPASVLNVMQTGRTASRTFANSGESAEEQMAIPFDYVVNGSYALKVTVK
jgi:hypothetical protein